MGSIKLILNIDRVDLVVAISVVLIAIISLIGLIAWFVKSGRRNKMLKAIDNKLTLPEQKPAPPEKIIITKSSASEPIIESKKNEIKKEEDEEPDVLEEIRKMMMTDSGYEVKSFERENDNIGKSGKAYTREEIEKLIND